MVCLKEHWHTLVFLITIFLCFCYTGSSLLRSDFLYLQQVRATPVVVYGLLLAVASLVAEHRLICSVACGIFLDQGSNPCPLHWPGGFFTTGPPGKPGFFLMYRVHMIQGELTDSWLDFIYDFDPAFLHLTLCQLIHATGIITRSKNPCFSLDLNGPGEDRPPRSTLFPANRCPCSLTPFPPSPSPPAA